MTAQQTGTTPRSTIGKNGATQAAAPAAPAGVPGAGARYANGGMVASASTTAAAAGLRVLMEGGNAFDAALTTAFVEGLTLPGACGLGGDMFAVLYEAKTSSVYAINGSGIAPQATSRDYFVSRGHTAMPLTGIHSVSVPGAPHAYWTLHQRFGSRPWAALIEPAIRLAEEGMAVSPRYSRSLAGSRAKLGQCAYTLAEFFPGGEPPRPGSIFRRPRYARSLRQLAEGGADAYYRGPAAAEIVRASQEAGGLFTLEDFAKHESELYEPIHVNYRGVEVYSQRPPSQGLLLLEELSLLEGFDLQGAGAGTAEAIHAMAEAKKLAFADRLRYAGDPRFVDVPLRELLSKSYAARRRQKIDPRRAASQVEGALPEDLHGDTSYFCVADGQGNAISFIHSLSAGFGSGVVGGETGIPLNNRAGRGFTLQEGHPNVIAGGKKTMHTLHCYLMTRDGQLYGVGGTPGGDQQPQWNMQVISNLLDFGMDPQQAVEAPRWYSFPGTDPEHAGNPFELRVEARVDPEVRRELASRGHLVVELGPWGASSACQVILRTPEGALVGGSDPRPGGIALGF